MVSQGMPYRSMTPWWHGQATHHVEAPATFRTASPVGVFDPTTPPPPPGTIHSTDPRLTPAGDVTRQTRVPFYVPFAVLNPGHITTTPQ
jgi:hypothetical protein